VSVELFHQEWDVSPFKEHSFCAKLKENDLFFSRANRFLINSRLSNRLAHVKHGISAHLQIDVFVSSAT